MGVSLVLSVLEGVSVLLLLLLVVPVPLSLEVCEGVLLLLSLGD